MEIPPISEVEGNHKVVVKQNGIVLRVLGIYPSLRDATEAKALFLQRRKEGVNSSDATYLSIEREKIEPEQTSN
jgi:hypothetical protein